MIRRRVKERDTRVYRRTMKKRFKNIFARKEVDSYKLGNYKTSGIRQLKWKLKEDIRNNKSMKDERISETYRPKKKA